MKTVILTCDTGGGHNSAAKAIREALERRGVDCELVNALDFMPRVQSRVISRGHVFAYKKLPKLYGVGYRFEENHTPNHMYRQCGPASEKLYPFLLERNCRAVICVHVFPALMMTHILRTCGHRFFTCFVATDYTCSPGVELTEMDAYCIPRELTQEFALCGLPLEKLTETGIPVGGACYHAGSRRATRKELGLDPARRQVVVSCGSMGCGPMRSLAVLLAETLPEDTDLTVLCGSNRSLKRDLSLLNRKEHVRVLGFTDKMFQWLGAADVLLSKPGGLTSTEAMTMGVPFICINAVPGCETRNLRFFLRHGYAVTARHVPGLVERTVFLLEREEEREAMAARQRAAFAPNAAAAIADVVAKAAEM